MKQNIFYAIIFAFLSGVFARSVLFLPMDVVYGFLITGFVFLIFYIFVRKDFLLISFFIFVFLGFGIFRFHLKDVNAPKNVFDEMVGKNIAFEGVIKEEVDRRENNQRLVVGFDDVRILVSADLYPEFFYGDRVSVSGRLSKPKNFKTDVGKEFNYINYLAKDDIYYNVSFAKVSLVESGQGSKLKSFLLKNKRIFLDKIEDIIPDPGSSLLGGILLGTKQSLGEKLENDFVRTGLIHIVVLSGYNVTIIAEAILRTLSFLPQIFSISLGIISIISFAIMTGAGPTIVRASVMAILSLIARSTGNVYHITRALVFSGALMVLHNPYILYFDISFQLSFLATLGLIYLSPIFKRYFMWLPERFGLQDIASATIATQVFVLPFILFKMGTLSLISPITNIIVLPVVPSAMFFGFLAGIVGMFSEFLATPFSFVSHILLSFQIRVVGFFSSLSFSTVEIRNFGFLWVVVIYFFIFWFIYKNYKIVEEENEKAR